jgi:hypothetical protein
MSKKSKYSIKEGAAGTDLTLNVQGLPNFVVLSEDLPDKVLGWLSRNTDLVIENEPKKVKNDCCE